MSSQVYVKGSDIYEAAVAGAKRGYNRSTDDSSAYADALNKCLQKLLSSCSREQRRRVLKGTGGKWKTAVLPLSLALIHKHIGGVPCEEHARVYLSTDPFNVFDIPIVHWDRFVENNKFLKVA